MKKKIVLILAALFIAIAIPIIANAETIEKAKIYEASPSEVLDSLSGSQKIEIKSNLFLPAFDITIVEESTYKLTTRLDNLSLSVLLKPASPQETLILVKSQVEPEYITDTTYVPKKTWVEGYYRKGTYVKGYYRKDGTYVRGHSRKGGYVKGHWRTTGTEAVTKTIKRYPYDITPEILGNLVYSILDSKYKRKIPMGR